MTFKAKYAITAAIASLLATMALATSAPEASAFTNREECQKKCAEKQEGALKKCQGGECRDKCPAADKKPSDACTQCIKPCLMPLLKEMHECLKKCD